MASVADDNNCLVCMNEPDSAVFRCCNQPIGSKCFFKIVDIAFGKPRVCPFCREDPIAAAKKLFVKEYGKNEAVISHLFGEGSPVVPVSTSTKTEELHKVVSNDLNLDLTHFNATNPFFRYAIVFRERVMEPGKTLMDYNYMGGQVKMKVRQLRN